MSRKPRRLMLNMELDGDERLRDKCELRAVTCCDVLAYSACIQLEKPSGLCSSGW